MCACQVHPSSPAPVCQASTQGQKTGTHSQRSYAKRKKKKSREMVKMRQIMQRESKRNHTFFVFCNCPSPTISCGNGAFRSLALHPGLLDFAIKSNYENVITVVWADLYETHLMFVKWELIRGTLNRHFWLVACFHFHVHYGYCKFRVSQMRLNALLSW